MASLLPLSPKLILWHVTSQTPAAPQDSLTCPHGFPGSLLLFIASPTTKQAAIFLTINHVKSLSYLKFSNEFSKLQSPSNGSEGLEWAGVCLPIRPHDPVPSGLSSGHTGWLLWIPSGSLLAWVLHSLLPLPRKFYFQMVRELTLSQMTPLQRYLPPHLPHRSHSIPSPHSIACAALTMVCKDPVRAHVCISFQSQLGEILVYFIPYCTPTTLPGS